MEYALLHNDKIFKNSGNENKQVENKIWIYYLKQRNKVNLKSAKSDSQLQ